MTSLTQQAGTTQLHPFTGRITRLDKENLYGTVSFDMPLEHPNGPLFNAFGFFLGDVLEHPDIRCTCHKGTRVRGHAIIYATSHYKVLYLEPYGWNKPRPLITFLENLLTGIRLRPFGIPA